MPGTTLGTAYVQIVPSARGISGAITRELDGEAGAAGTATGSKIGAFAKKALLKAGIAAAVVKTVKSSLDEGAKLQQSYLGGLDTLYGDAADAAREYAREASAAGISMNTYSEQAVSFGAALKNAYGGDTHKAMEAANTAILDMADNSAKMGTDIESVQMAYQGFAKQNYTMLDNLKLGYGGTKTEMERLLKDAEKLSGQTYSIDNLGDVYDAIHVIQGDLGLTGVAAKEASETFSGSFGAMKAATQNFLGSLALGEGIQQSLSTLVTSASTFFFGNFIPMLGTILKSLPSVAYTFIQQGVPILLTNLSSLISSLASQITGAAEGVTSEKVAEWAKTTLPKIATAAGNVILKFAQSLIQNLPKIVAAIGKIGAAILTGLGSTLLAKVSAAAARLRDKFMQPINQIRDKFQGVVNKIKGFFPLNIGKLINFKTPTITLNKKTASVLGKEITYPTGFSVAWHKTGGIFTEPTLLQAANGSIHGVGDVRGGEAIVPLTELWKHLDQRQEPVVINVYGSDNMSVNDIAAAVERRLTDAQKRRRLAWQ